MPGEISKLGCAHLQIRTDPILGKMKRRHISGGENHTLVNAKLPSAPPALRAGTSTASNGL